MSESHELNVNKEPLKKVKTYQVKEGHSSKSLASEPMNSKRLSISIKNENEEEQPLNNNNNQGTTHKKRITKSKTGINLASPKKSFSNTSSYKQGETFLRAGGNEEL